MLNRFDPSNCPPQFLQMTRCVKFLSGSLKPKTKKLLLSLIQLSLKLLVIHLTKFSSFRHGILQRSCQLAYSVKSLAKGFGRNLTRWTFHKADTNR